MSYKAEICETLENISDTITELIETLDAIQADKILKNKKRNAMKTLINNFEQKLDDINEEKIEINSYEIIDIIEFNELEKKIIEFHEIII